MARTSLDLVAELIEGLEPGAMVTRFVLVAEVFDPDGDVCVWRCTHDGSKPWETLGLLEWAATREAATLLTEDDGERHGHQL